MSVPCPAFFFFRGGCLWICSRATCARSTANNFLAAFGSALISCIYGVVDMAMVGQYQGPAGVLAGGIFNVFGDYFCVFTLDMGMFGTALPRWSVRGSRLL